MLLSSLVAMEVRVGDEGADSPQSKLIRSSKIGAGSGRVPLGKLEARVHADSGADHAESECRHRSLEACAGRPAKRAANRRADENEDFLQHRRASEGGGRQVDSRFDYLADW